jgi:hypothetical protein
MNGHNWASFESYWASYFQRLSEKHCWQVSVSQGIIDKLSCMFLMNPKRSCLKIVHGSIFDFVTW